MRERAEDSYDWDGGDEQSTFDVAAVGKGMSGVCLRCGGFGHRCCQLCGEVGHNTAESNGKGRRSGVVESVEEEEEVVADVGGVWTIASGSKKGGQR